MADGFVVTKYDRVLAAHGLRVQFNRHKMDLDDSNVKGLFDQLVKVHASNFATQRELSALVHSNLV